VAPNSTRETLRQTGQREGWKKLRVPRGILKLRLFVNLALDDLRRLNSEGFRDLAVLHPIIG
jgi:hypothetical protein